MKKLQLFTFLLLPLTISFCVKEEIHTLIVSTEKIDIDERGDTADFVINTNADTWEIDNPATEWLILSANSGSQGEAVITVTVNTRTSELRQDTLTVTAGNARPARIVVSQASTGFLYDLATEKTLFNFSNNGGSDSIRIQTDAPEWHLSCSADWVHPEKLSGGPGTHQVNFSVDKNTGTGKRTADIILAGENAPETVININQRGRYFPNYNTNQVEPDITGMTSSAMDIANDIRIGWNIGNTMEAIGGETAWGNPKISGDLIRLVKQSGFNAVRIPCAWNQYADPVTGEIKASWLSRVKEVVQYCVDNDMYVVLNIHWDGGWLENNCTPDKQEINVAKQKAFWEQIATYLRDFDEHLIFAGANEPNVDNATQMNVLLSYHQAFIDAVRSTGGKNTYRVLVVQGPSTDIEKTSKLMTRLPSDPTPDRLMVEIHYYTPWNFCGMTEDASWGKMFYYWGKDNHSSTDTRHNPTWGEEDVVNNNFGMMKSQFVDHGIPVILGEYEATRRSNLTGDALTLHLASRAYFHKYVTRQARAYGLVPFYWDNGGLNNFASGIFNRRNLTVFDQQTLDALMQGVNE